jgi:hypothetical protein
MHKTMQNSMRSLLFILALLLSSLTPFSFDRPPDPRRLLAPIKKFKISDITNLKSLPSISSSHTAKTLRPTSPNSPLARLLTASKNCKTQGYGPTCGSCWGATDRIIANRDEWDFSDLSPTYTYDFVKFIYKEGPFILDQKDSKCRMVCLAGYRTAFDSIDDYDSQRCTQAFCKTFDYHRDTCTGCWAESDYQGLGHNAWGGKDFMSRAATLMLDPGMPFKMNYGESKF